MMNNLSWNYNRQMIILMTKKNKLISIMLLNKFNKKNQKMNLKMIKSMMISNKELINI